MPPTDVSDVMPPMSEWPESLRSSVGICLGSNAAMVVLWGPKLLMTYNGAFGALLGDRHPWAHGRSAIESWPELADILAPLIGAAGKISGGAKFFEGLSAQARSRASKGPVSYSLGPIQQADGSMGGILAIAHEAPSREREQESREISELMSASKDMQSQLRLYEAILSTTPDLVYVFDLSHRFIYANTELLKMWGRTWDEAIGKNCLELGYEPWNAEMHDREIERVIATGLPIRGEVPFAGTFGRRMYDYIFVPVFGETGEVLAIAGTTRDVTERQQMEDTLRSQAEQLRENNQRKDEFIATLAHELRNPLAPIRNSVYRLRRTPDQQPSPKLFDMLDRQVRQIARLLDDLLDVSRVSRGVIELQRSDVDLRTAIHDAVESCRPLIESGRHRLEVTLPEQAQIINGDPVRLTQIVSNLLSNAARYTDKGGDLRISLERQGELAQLHVQDNGIGMQADQLPRIFQMFGQLDRSNPRSQGGLGIGLALAQRLAQMHDGDLRALSAGLGRGSTFTLSLPLVLAQMQAPSPSSQKGQESHPNAGALRILVVDDNRDSAESMGLLLDHMGFETRVATDGPSALSEIDAWRPRVALLDVGMPGMDGCEVAQRARAGHGAEALTLIAMTGWGQESDRIRTRQAGFDHHLTKPVDPDDVLEIVRGLG